MTVLVTLLAVVVALLAVLVAGLLRTNADVLRALDRLGEGLEPGTGTRRTDSQPAASARTGRPAVDFSGTTLDGGARVIRTTGVPHDTLLLFLSSGCLTCRSFWDAVAAPGGLGLPPRIRVAIITKDLSEESPSALADLAPGSDVPVLQSTRAWKDYEIPGSPYTVLVDGTSGTVIGEGTGSTWAQVADLLAQATGDLAYVGEGTPQIRKSSRDMTADIDTDAELLAAGIRPGDATLYPGAPHPGDPPTAGPAGDPGRSADRRTGHE